MSFNVFLDYAINVAEQNGASILSITATMLAVSLFFIGVLLIPLHRFSVIFTKQNKK